MSKNGRQLDDYRKLRDAARELVLGDLAHVRKEMEPEALGSRIADNIGERADAASDRAAEFAGSHSGKLLALGLAVMSGAALWIGRRPLLDKASAVLERLTADSPDAAIEEAGMPEEDQLP